MKKILIIGAGGLGRELVDVIASIGMYDIAGFLDDDLTKINTYVNGVRVINTIDKIEQYRNIENLAIAVANPTIKQQLYNRCKHGGFRFPNLIHPSVIMGSNVSFGIGNLVFANTFLSTEVTLDNFITISPKCGVGHESTLHSYSTLYWGVDLGGNVTIGQSCELGTHACVIQGLSITDDVVLGAGAVVVKNILEKGTYVGVPTRKID